MNIPTVGRVPGGATVERQVPSPFPDTPYLVLNLNRPDFATAAAVAKAINQAIGEGTASALDGTSVQVRAPADAGHRVAFMGMLEELRSSLRRPRPGSSSTRAPARW